MGACCGREQGPRNHLIPDVEQILADDAWNEFRDVSRRRFRFKRMIMRRSDYNIEVPMNYYHFQETKQEVSPMESLKTVRHAESKASGATQSGSELKGKQLAHQDKTSPEHNRLQTRFRNDTDKTQTYSFKFEKTRNASVTVTYQRGFSIGGKANFTLGLDTGLEGEVRYEVTKATGETFQETLTTTASSDIRVSRHSNCIATVVMEERHLQANFTVEVVMSMPEKEALVFIKDKHGKIVFVKQINNLAIIFPARYHIYEDEKTEERGAQVEQGGSGGEESSSPSRQKRRRSRIPRPDAVKFVVKGIVEGTLLSDHHIRLKSRRLSKGSVKELTGADGNSDEEESEEDNEN